MKKPILFLPGATTDMDEALAWHRAERAGLETEFEEAIDEALSQIEAHPQAFPLTRSVPAIRSARRCLAKRFPYSVIFVEHDRLIIIVAIAHHRRRQTYWKDRH